jgi:hypothetical protein
VAATSGSTHSSWTVPEEVLSGDANGDVGDVTTLARRAPGRCAILHRIPEVRVWTGRAGGMPNWRGLMQHVADEAHSGDRVLFLSRLGRRPFEYYLDRHGGLASSLTPAYPWMPWGRRLSRRS